MGSSCPRPSLHGLASESTTAHSRPGVPNSNACRNEVVKGNEQSQQHGNGEDCGEPESSCPIQTGSHYSISIGLLPNHYSRSTAFS